MPCAKSADVDLTESLAVPTDPTGSGVRAKYRSCHIFGQDDEVPVILVGKEVGQIRVRELLP